MSSEIDWLALRVLCVDSDKGYGRLIERMVRDLRVRNVVVANNADEAKAFLAGAIFDFVIVDWAPDNSNGAALTEFLRDKSATPAPHVPVIWTVEEGTVTNITTAIKFGADHVLVKPISVGDIESSIKGLIESPPERADVANYIGPCRRRLPSRVYAPFSGQDRRQFAPEVTPEVAVAAG